MISLNEISLSFAEKVIFNKISFLFSQGSFTGLVGENGTGKTTLLRSILNPEILDEGTIEYNLKFSLALLEQEGTELPSKKLLDFIMIKTGMSDLENNLSRLEKEMSVADHTSKTYEKILSDYQETLHGYEHKGGYSFKPECLRILQGLGFKPGDEQKKCSEFSGGWRIRINLALLLLSKPDIMLLDEPTNHLDTESMEWLESYLKKYSGTIITISHDKRFLNKLSNQIIELHKGDLTVYKGNYDYYEKEKALRIEKLKKEYESQQNEIKKIQEFIERFRSKASKAKQVQSRIKMLEKFEEIKLYEDSKKIKIRFPEATPSGLEVIKATKLTKQYDDNLVLDMLDFTIERAEKIALVGVNGAGKSTLSRLISLEEEPTSGNIEHGYKVKPAYFSQISSENLDLDLTIWEEINNTSSKLNDIEKRTLLGAFLFSGDDIYKKINVLSGGEKSRVALLKILLNESNLLILDEPTNHLDQKTKDIFQKALKEYNGTIIIVSHDRYFLDGLISKVFEVKNSKIKTYLGNYSYFIEKREKDNDTYNESDNKEKSKQCSLENIETKTEYKTKEQKRAKAELRNKISSQRKKLEKKISELEEKLAILETEKAVITEELGKPENHSNSDLIISLNKKFTETDNQITETMESWERKSLELEELLEQLG